jgi:hypothetical protein
MVKNQNNKLAKKRTLQLSVTKSKQLLLIRSTQQNSPNKHSKYKEVLRYRNDTEINVMSEKTATSHLEQKPQNSSVPTAEKSK